MELSRLFNNAKYKGSKGYLNIQKKYEIGRTILYFFISASLFIAGYIQTKERINVLSLVAALGCLPACKSLVVAIMFCRYKSLDKTIADKIEENAKGLYSLFDMVFTSEKKNFLINHLVVHQNLIIGYSNHPTFEEKAFYEHIQNILTLDGHNEVTVKIFTDITKYEQRVTQLQEVPFSSEQAISLCQTLKSVTL